MCLSEEVRYEICAPRYTRERFSQALHVILTVFQINLARIEVRWIADNGISFRPFGEEGVGADDVFVEIIEWQRFFFDEQLVGLGELLRFDQFQVPSRA